MNINLSGVNRIPGFPTNSGGLNAPDWSAIPHAGMATPSKEELVQQIKDAGTKFAHATSEEEKRDIISQLTKLEVQYVSSVSPDRKTLYKDAMQVINQHKATANQKQPKSALSFVEFLCEQDGVKTRQYDLTNYPEPLLSGGAVSAASRGFLGFEYMIDVGGAQVMGTSGNNWRYSPTPDECKKANEVTKIFNKAKEYELMKQQNSIASTDNSNTESSNSFNMRA